MVLNQFNEKFVIVIVSNSFITFVYMIQILNMLKFIGFQLKINWQLMDDN